MQKPIYPWLLSIFPIVYLYSMNLGIVTDAQVPIAIGFSLAITTLLFTGLRAITGNSHKAAAIAGLALFYFYYYGHIAAWLEGGKYPALQAALPFAFPAATAAFALWIWRSPPAVPSPSASAALNIGAIVLLAFYTYGTAPYLFERLTTTPDAPLAEDGHKGTSGKVYDGPHQPDIYYIIVDGYSSNRQLQRDYRYDNSRFTKALEQLGFFIAYDSKSNYGTTLHSLGSSLNMRYMTKRPKGWKVHNLVFLRMMIADSDVARFLQRRGYTYIYMMSGFLLPSRLADVNLDFSESGRMEYQFSELKSEKLNFNSKSILNGSFYKEPFTRLLVETSLLRLFRESLEPYVQRGRSYLWSDPRRFEATLEELESVPERPEATFTFVHLMEPHIPVQLGRNGKRLATPTTTPTRKQFFAELQFTNQRLLDTLAEILEKSTTPPIIILQGDHGSHLGDPWTRDGRLTNFEILNALHLPKRLDGTTPEVARDISPINLFGILLREYFGMDYEPQVSRQFDLPQGYHVPFHQIDVTEEFQTSTGG